MRRALGTLAVLTAAAVHVLAQGPVAQTTAAPSRDETPPERTPWGDPDLQGVWDYATNTPLQRPPQWAEREQLTPVEIAETDRFWSTFATSERRAELDPQFDLSLNFNQIWWDLGRSIGRTSLITDPPDGRFPPKTAARVALETSASWRPSRTDWRIPARGPEDLSVGDRCIVETQVPIRPRSDNNHVRVLQTPDAVVLYSETIHDVRVIPVDGRPRPSPHLRQWLGVSRGHWEGDTLVVETTGFHRDAEFFGSGAHRHVVERVRRLGPSSLEYTFTVSDPTVWTRPWTARVPWRATDGRLHEYACHEGNYSMALILRGARADEQAARTRPARRR